MYQQKKDVGNGQDTDQLCSAITRFLIIERKEQNPEDVGYIIQYYRTYIGRLISMKAASLPQHWDKKIVDDLKHCLLQRVCIEKSVEGFEEAEDQLQTLFNQGIPIEDILPYVLSEPIETCSEQIQLLYRIVTQVQAFNPSENSTVLRKMLEAINGAVPEISRINTKRNRQPTDSMTQVQSDIFFSLLGNNPIENKNINDWSHPVLIGTALNRLSWGDATVSISVNHLVEAFVQEQILAAANSHDCSNVLNALTKVEHNVPKKHIDAIVRRFVEICATTNAQDCALVLHALTKVTDGAAPKESIHAIVQRFVEILATANSQECANVFWSLYMFEALEEYMCDTTILQALARRVQTLSEKGASFSLESSKQILQASSWFDVPIEGCDPAQSSQQESMSDFENQIFTSLPPNTQRFTNIGIYGCELDLYYPEFGKNIEIDGRYHQERQKIRTDCARDRLLKKKGIDVIRIFYPMSKTIELISELEKQFLSRHKKAK